MGLALTAGLHAIVFGGSAALLPWDRLSWPALFLGALALGHGALALASGLGSRRWVRPVWLGISLVSVLSWGVLSALMASAGLYLHQLYQGIGTALAGGLVALSAALASFTLPIALWGFAVLRPRWLPRRARMTGGALALLIALGGATWVGSSGRPELVATWGDTQPAELWTRVRARLPAPAKKAHQASLLRLAPVACEKSPRGPELTALLTWLGRDGKPRSRCVQAPSVAALEDALVELLSEGGQAPSAAVVDFVVAGHRLWSLHPALDGLKLRAARDGVCGDRACLAPWQLVARDSFTQSQPLEAVPDMRFGASLETLRIKLKASKSERLLRIETETHALVRQRSEQLSRLRPARQEPDLPQVQRSVRAAERHILSAQQRDGRFRYSLDPFTGRSDASSLNLPRQAGTTLVLCELGEREERRRAIQASLRLLGSHERALAEFSLLTTDGRQAGLGHTALPLIAFLACREGGEGGEHDELVGRLAEFLLRMQRPDGSFFPEYDLVHQTPRGEHEAMYAAGQAVLALVLLEQRLGELRLPELRRSPEGLEHRVKEAIDRAMTHYATAYWPALLRPFFFLEENWHCLAARAALGSHRHEAYERLCLDYVAFKSRLILRASEVESDLVGGYGVSAVFEPHNTGSAGFGEALAAALALQRARGEDRSAHLALMQDVLGFLVRAQWNQASCFACTRKHRVVGGFSEHAGSPVIRIDYVQHAMAALGHGGRELFEGS